MSTNPTPAQAPTAHLRDHRRRFRVLSEIAEGAFGKVYLAEQLAGDGFSRVVALKILHSQYAADPEITARMRDEARLLGRIRHPNIVQVEDLTTIDGKCTLVMEYLEGVDAKALWAYFRVLGRPFPRKAAFQLGAAVAGALDSAYRIVPLQGGTPLGVIHRDIKPSNLFVTTAGVVKVLDFGTARANFREREAKTKARTFGSAGYLAPERILRKTDTPAADVFSLAVTLHELLALEPFGMVNGRKNKFVQQLDERMARLGTVTPHVRALLRRMLAFDPDERPSALDVADQLGRLAAEAEDEDMDWLGREVVPVVRSRLKPAGRDGLVGQVVDEEDPLSPRAPRSRRRSAVEPAYRSAARRFLRDGDRLRFWVALALGGLLIVGATGVVIGVLVLAVYLGTQL
jgi:serine/threonine protein kinase